MEPVGEMMMTDREEVAVEFSRIGCDKPPTTVVYISSVLKSNISVDC